MYGDVLITDASVEAKRNDVNDIEVISGILTAFKTPLRSDLRDGRVSLL